MTKKVTVQHKDTIINKKGHTVDRLLLDVNGKIVQVNRYNKDNNRILVAMKGRIRKWLKMDEVEKFVDDRTD